MPPTSVTSESSLPARRMVLLKGGGWGFLDYRKQRRQLVIEITGAKGGTKGESKDLPHIFYMVWYQASGNGVGWGYYGNTPGCSLAIVWARTKLLPPTWSFTASTSLLHVGFPNLSTWSAENRHRIFQDCHNMSTAPVLHCVAYDLAPDDEIRQNLKGLPFHSDSHDIAASHTCSSSSDPPLVHTL